MATTSQLWLDQQVRALQSLAAMPAIQSMDSSQQRPYLQALVNAHPEIYLISTTDLNGMNVARNDDEDMKDYNDRYWFQQAASGYPVTFQTLIGRTSNVPALVISAPIRNENGVIIGVSMFASYLELLADEVKSARIGSTGYGYIVDENFQVIAHPDSTLVDERLDLSEYPPVAMLSAGQQGPIRFMDDIGRSWRANSTRLSNGWGIVVQQEERELLIPLRLFQQFAGLVLVLGGLFLLLIVALTIRQSFRPIRSLLDTANAITQGDLTRVAPVDSEDELGVLAATFNTMTGQLRELIINLEKRVHDRTQDLERRAVQLQVTAEVARESSGIRDLEELLHNTVHLISDRFGFYHAGIFLLDEQGEYAVLRAANSEGGQLMLEKGHKLQVGQTGIVGYATAHGEPRFALDVGEDAVYFNNPYLPETRSEISLPLNARGRIIGALDVQSRKPAAFGPEDIEILQILADQIALAIENARLLTESQETLQELETLYGKQVSQAWQNRLETSSIAYTLDQLGVKRASDGQLKAANGEPDPQTLSAPILLRGQQLGSIALQRADSQAAWTEEEAQLVNATVNQIALALENARLLETVQRNAHQEQLVGQISAHAQSSLDLDNVMKIAVQEIGLAIAAARVQISLRTDSPTPEVETVIDLMIPSGN
jgi:GAF domain-containing protein/HAMP domain-containing protein